MTLVGDLFALQEIDSQIDQRVAALEELRGRHGESDEAAEVRAELAEHAAGLPDLEARQRDLDLQVASIKERAAPVETKLYDGSITNSKELTDLQRDLEQITRHRQAVEEELLGVLEQVEAKRAGVQASAARLEQVETAWAGAQADLRADEERVERELAALRERRTAQAARILPATVTAYDRLRQRRKGMAVVKVERGNCLGCRLTVPPVVLQRARSGMNPNPVQCPSCERILYVL